MKKNGLLNAELMGELTKLRHQDKFVICDIGFPIPKGGQSGGRVLSGGVA